MIELMLHPLSFSAVISGGNRREYYANEEDNDGGATPVDESPT